MGTYSTHEALLKAVQRFHENNGWPGAAYHFLITKDGTIYQLNDFTEVTWHDTRNWDSIGVALEGYFHPPHDEKPTTAQLQSLDWLLDKLCTETPEIPADHDDVLGHRERSSTACPGNNLFPFVTEYRIKKGSVSWGEHDNSDNMEDGSNSNKIKELEEVIIGLRSSRNKWKQDYGDLEKLLESERKSHAIELGKIETEIDKLETYIETSCKDKDSDEITEKEKGVIAVLRQLANNVDGRKTYVIAAVLAIIVVLEYLGIIDASLAESLIALLGAGGLATLRHGVAKGK